MTTLHRHLSAWAYNNAWANHRLLGACARLSQADFVAERVSFFPSLKSTLNHILTVDWYYVDAVERCLAGMPPNPEFVKFYEPEEPFDRCEDLWREQRAVDRRLVDACEAMGEADMERMVRVPRRVGVLEEPMHRLLAHLFQHAIHHRGQVHAMLAGTPVKPPQLDEFFCANEVHLREAELRELGFSEAQVWKK
jgi:uncharacterized damage-inducible protein DinB